MSQDLGPMMDEPLLIGHPKHCLAQAIQHMVENIGSSVCMSEGNGNQDGGQPALYVSGGSKYK